MNRKRLWLLSGLGVIVMIAIIYNPWTLSPGKIEPKLGVLPFHLWFGFLSMLILLGLTALGAYSHPTHHNNEEDL